ncbi:MAG: APC family permease [Acidobacteria bacterium]|nr:MAG: APC family permease [Acidobacteriota bacterium]
MSAPPSPTLSPTLKPLQVGALSLGCIIGFGCFVLPGDFLVTAGPLGATLGVLLGGAAMLIIARSYGVMVRAFPVAGAEFAYAYHACGRYHAYVCGWFLALGYLSIVPLNATALAVLGTFVAPQLFARGSLYTVAGFEVFAGEVVLASAAIVGIGLFQIRGVRSVGRLQLGMTALLVGGVLVVGLGTPLSGAASAANLQPYFAPDRGPLAGVLAMLAIAPWLYVGFDTLPQAAEEFDFSPRQGLRLMVISIGAGAVMYAVVILATASVMPWQDLVAGEPLWATGATVRASLGTTGLACLALAVTMAVFTGINGFFMASSRLLFSMGRSKLLPPWFGQIHPTHHTPANAIRFVGVVSLAAPWFGREVIVWVVDMAALGTAFGYFYTCLGAARLAQTGQVDTGPGGRRYALVGAALSVGFIVLLTVPGMPGFMAAPSWIALAAWVSLGLGFFARAGEYRALPTSELDHLILRR